MSGISNAADGLVQAIADNVDADTSSQNGRQSTHSLAVLLTQYSQAPSEGDQVDNLRIRRVPNDSLMLISTGTRDRKSHKCLNPML